MVYAGTVIDPGVTEISLSLVETLVITGCVGNSLSMSETQEC